MVVVFPEYLGNIDVAKKHSFKACATVFSGRVERLPRTIPQADAVKLVRQRVNKLILAVFYFNITRMRLIR
jgi:hypothetical protein